MKAQRAPEFALGVTVTARTLYAVLLEVTPEGARFVRSFTRERGASAAAAPTVTTPSMAGFGGDDDDAATLTVGEGRSSGELFLASEFGHLSQSGPSAEKPGEPAAVAEADLFADDLYEILSECRDAYGIEPPMALVLPGQDVATAEVRVDDGGPRERDDKRRARMLAAAAETVPDVDPERTVFLPMASEPGTLRALALVPRVNDPTTVSLGRLRGRQRGLPSARLLDAELPLYIGLARLTPGRVVPPAAAPEAGDGAVLSLADLYGGAAFDAPADAPAEPAPAEAPAAPSAPVEGVTLVLRAGSDDTLALFLRDGDVLHFEHLRSVTGFDAPETICSRVLLLQDEHGMGDVARILVLSDGDEQGLLDTFTLFFPDANVAALRYTLPAALAEDAGRMPEPAVVPAFAAALRLAGPAATQAAFPAVNLLPRTMLRRRVVVPYTWHVYALMGLLFVTALFFVARFLTLDARIDDQRAKVAVVDPAAAEASVQVLQARIDSLQGVQTTYEHALGVLDSLLMGSDRWSRALELTATQSAAVRGMWVENWKDEGAHVTLTGNATSRERIVQFAEGTGGALSALTFAEIRDYPVYTFALALPLSNEMPEAARYLRDQAAQAAQAAAQAAAPSAPAGPAAPVAAGARPAGPVAAAPAARRPSVPVAYAVALPTPR